MNSTKRSDIALAIAWLAIFLTMVYFIAYGVKTLAEPVSKIIAAVFTGLFALIGAYVTHLLTSQRNRETEQIRRKQERYAEILQGLVPYIRSKGTKADEFAIAVLHAYVVGNKRVARDISTFLENRTPVSLDSIVASMRADLGMEELDNTTSTKGLLPPPDQVGTV